MLYLIVTVCSISLGCREVAAGQGLSTTECGTLNQLVLARWKTDSPEYSSGDWRIESFRCDSHLTLRERT